jgi:hypothetical protein
LPLLGGLVLLLLSCSGEDDPLAPSFPTDYAASYVEVRDCRFSGEHDLSPVRVLTDPSSADAYVNRDRAFAEGAIIIKAEYDFADPACEGEIQRWTVMVREAAGSAPERLDWYWQEVDAGRAVVNENDTRCIGCHTGCGAPPDGYLGTCSIGASFGALGSP